MQENLEYPNRMAEYFSGKTVFVTGATGFVGKVFVEKILRTCPDVKKVYVMARSKKSQTAEERFDTILNSVVSITYLLEYISISQKTKKITHNS